MIPEFDRFYFNLHGDRREDGFLVLGVGMYPPKGIGDGYVCLATGGEQRNLRFSQHLECDQPRQIGPLRWRAEDSDQDWHLNLAPNPIGLELDLRWSARAPVLAVENYRTADSKGESSYDHWFQSGRYRGTMTVDGQERDVSGWFGQRDRSCGSRRVRDRLGMHLWLQAQFASESIGLLFNLGRDGSIAHLAGAVMGEDASSVPITAVRHNLDFGQGYELRSGAVEIDAGGRRRIEFRSTGPGIYMQGAGYDGWHGADHGSSRIESERWPLDGSRNPRNLSFGITDALCEFLCEGQAGVGITEYALTRSPAYRYQPDPECRA